MDITYNELFFRLLKNRFNSFSGSIADCLGRFNVKINRDNIFNHFLCRDTIDITLYGNGESKCSISYFKVPLPVINTFSSTQELYNYIDTLDVRNHPYDFEKDKIKRIEGEYFTCTSSGETFKIGDKAYLIYNDELDEEDSCIDIITKYDSNNMSIAFFSSHEKGIEWNHAKFKK